MEVIMSAILGVDIAKKKFDVTLLNEKGGKRRKTLANTPAGFQALSTWLQRHTNAAIHVCMESTSVYWEDLAEYLHEAGHQVSVVNPVRIKGYAMSQLRRSKTDALDGDIIADFCRTQKPKLWTPPTKKQKKLRSLVRHLETLKKSRTQQRNRLHVCRDDEVKESLEAVLAVLDSQIEQVKKRVRALVNEDPDLKEKKELLESIKGFGEKTAIHILAEMYDLDKYENAKAVAADVGVTASHYSSGSSVRRRSKMSRMGKASIRGALHFPAITAMQHNPVIKKLVKRLEARGKLNSVIRVAVMRKLMHIAYGVLKHKKPFDPNYETSMA
jgi:transposase